MINNLNAPPDWEGELESLMQRMKNFFLKNRINEFLQMHHQINVLFSNKLQSVIDKKPEPHATMDYNFNVDPSLVKKIETFNENMSKLVEANPNDGKIKIQRKTLQDKAY